MKRFALGTLVVLTRAVWLTALLGLAALVGVAHVAPQDGRSMFIVRSPSMEPAIGRGALIVVSPTPAEQLAVGDVISMRRGATVLTHRISAVSAIDGALRFETRGDANTNIDPALVEASDIIGRVSISVPFAGYGMAFLGEPVGILAVLSLLGTLLLASWLVEDSLGAYRGAIKPRSVVGGAAA